MQLFAGLMLNRVWIALEPFDMTLQLVVFLLQTVQLTVQTLRILSLLLIRRQTVLPKDNVVPHRQREQRRSARCNLAPTLVTSLIQTHQRARLLRLRARLSRTSHTTKYKLHITHRQGGKTLSRKDVPSSYRHVKPDYTHIPCKPTKYPALLE